MVEPVLYASLGALIATLLGLLFLPFFWRRAVRLTTRRLVNRLPVSASEIVAAQDRLRAELAMTMRETERRAQSVTAEATRERVDSARARATELGHLADIAELKSQVSVLEAEGVKARGERDKSGEQAATAFAALEQARAAADQAARDLQAARQDASAARSATEQARIEAAEREAEIAALKAKLTMLGLDKRASEPSSQPAGKPRMPHVDRPFEADGDVDAAGLAALRRRLDEVADQIVKAAQTLPTAIEAPKADQADQAESDARKVEPAEPRRMLPRIAAN